MSGEAILSLCGISMIGGFILGLICGTRKVAKPKTATEVSNGGSETIRDIIESLPKTWWEHSWAKLSEESKSVHTFYGEVYIGIIQYEVKGIKWISVTGKDENMVQVIEDLNEMHPKFKEYVSIHNVIIKNAKIAS